MPIRLWKVAKCVLYYWFLKRFQLKTELAGKKLKDRDIQNQLIRTSNEQKFHSIKREHFEKCTFVILHLKLELECRFVYRN